MKQTAVISHNNYYSQFMPLFVNWYNNKTPSTHQAILLPNRINKYGSRKVMFHLLNELVLPVVPGIFYCFIILYKFATKLSKC
jgi:hypothetical protein